MDKLEKLCKRYDVPTPAELIDDKPEQEHLYSLNIKSKTHQGITKVNHTRETIQKISNLNDRVTWLKAAKAHCDRILKLINPDNLLDHAIKYETGVKEPIGFIRVRELIFERIDQCKKVLKEQQSNKSENVTSKKKKPHNYAGELTSECTKALSAYRDEKNKLGINEFFRLAHSKLDCCQHAIKDGKKNKIGWHTLRNRIKESHPEIYYSKK